MAFWCTGEEKKLATPRRDVRLACNTYEGHMDETMKRNVTVFLFPCKTEKPMKEVKTPVLELCLLKPE